MTIDCKSIDSGSIPDIVSNIRKDGQMVTGFLGGIYLIGVSCCFAICILISEIDQIETYLKMLKYFPKSKDRIFQDPDLLNKIIEYSDTDRNIYHILPDELKSLYREVKKYK